MDQLLQAPTEGRGQALGFARRRLKLTPKQARALDLLKEVGIPAAAERIDHYPHQFPGGMRQRVVIALAPSADPKLIIADEPTTALDLSIQAQIIILLKRLCSQHGAAVMPITHDMGVIACRLGADGEGDSMLRLVQARQKLSYTCER